MSASAPLPLDASAPTPIAPSQDGKAMRGAYVALIVFLLIYCGRPEDWLPALAPLHLDKIAGGLAIAAAAMSAISGRHRLTVPRSLKLLIALFAQLAFAAVLSPVWRGGAMQIVFNQFSKAVVIAIVVAWVTMSLARLRTLLFVQAVAVVVIGLVSMHAGNTVQGRLEGALGGSYSNPNDLALSLALALPLCLAFLLRSRSKLVKLLWLGAILSSVYVVTLTFSRAGLLSVLVALGICVWELGVQGKRRGLVAAAILACIIAPIAAIPSGYGRRVATIFSPESDPTGSAQARLVLQEKSLLVTFEHPLFGVGPGNFEVIAGDWHVSHNAFLQISSEGGVLAFLLYVFVLGSAFGVLRRLRRSEVEAEAKLWGGVLRACLAAYIVGSLFASVAYLFFPYLLVGFVCGLEHAASLSPGPQVQQRTALDWDRALEAAG